ncbi:ecto-NOX disulfide-thiol exchanger 2-like isoform X2 [Dreissena polymorpha]|uniref:ecto-NOX disulfide-thiol exchanger 2-like isoform X2 n=1 Tax=Dreissena polymorpha TaxID=45954 RepID=UPI002263D0D3|nr:ecto-NOX disulfide-thiol exchanger 2-like isoform X2 [Dreissena polymorpha]
MYPSAYTQNLKMMGMESGYVDPRMNNQPLAFNPNKGKPPMAMDKLPEERHKNDKYDDGMGMGAFTAKLLNIPQNDQPYRDMDDGMQMSMQQGMDSGMMMQGGPGFFPMGGMNPMMSMMGQSDMMAMGNMGNMGPGPGNMMMFGGMPGWQGPIDEMGMPIMPVKEIIRKENSVLYPPPPNAPPPTTRERPPGCRTIFVGGLPETCTEEMLQEVFVDFGITTSVRKSKKKNFAHVRFEHEESVERALFLSGYRMKVEDKDDKPNTGRLHVDYAMARDDQYEFECKQRSMIRDMRHRQRMEEDRLRPPSPPPTAQYSDYEAAALHDQLKNDEDFMKASSTLLTWMERGDVNRRNINQFYSMIQCVNSHIRRLLSEKQAHEEELMAMKQRFKSLFEGLLRQFDQIEKVFVVAQKQRNWDHFTKAQRKNVEMWLKQAKEIKQSQQDEFLSGRQEDEMEMSEEDDSGGPSNSKKAKRPDVNEYSTNQYVEMASRLALVNNLKDENDELKCQLEVYKNEVAVLKQETGTSSTDREKEVRSLQMAMQGMQQQLITVRNEHMEYKKKMEQEKSSLVLEKQIALDKYENLKSEKLRSEQQGTTSKNDEDNQTEEKDKAVKYVWTDQSSKVGDDTISSTGIHFSDKEAQLVGLVCCFLHVHPTGASIDYIWSYLHRLGVSCRVSELETLLEKIPVIFRQELSGVGATIERRWHFTGYKNLSPTTGL